MADSVQEIMEKMVSDLQDLEINGVFSHEEINSIIRKRRNAEYSLHSHTKKIEDYVSAVQYEINLESLRLMRKKRLGIEKALISDADVIRRIHFIFERMVRKYNGDLNVWCKYIEYCESTNNNGKLASLYPRILQLHPRAEGIWVKAANWEMSQGNFNNARILLQRAIRINKSSNLLWKEYFRFELVYINMTEERRRVLGLSSLRDRLLSDTKDITLSDMFETTATEEIVNDDSETKLQSNTEEKTDSELLEQDDAILIGSVLVTDVENPKEEAKSIISEKEANVNHEMDRQIKRQSEANQALFLQGAIPKVIYRNACEDCPHTLICVDLLRISYSLKNVYVEQFILQDILDNHWTDLSIWPDLLSYPITRVLDILQSEDQSLVKRQQSICDECKTMCLNLAETATAKLLSSDISIDSSEVYAMLIRGLQVVSKNLASVGNVNDIYDYVNTLFIECKERGFLSCNVVLEMMKFYANRGMLKESIELIQGNEMILFREVESFMKTMNILCSVATRSEYIISEVLGVQDVNQFVIQRFEEGIKYFGEKEISKEDNLRLYVRYLKFLISINFGKDKINSLFHYVFQIDPSLNAPVFSMYLSYCFESGMTALRKAIDFALSNEVIIPLEADVFEECLEYERKWMASLDDNSDEQIVTIARIERLYDAFTKRYPQNCDLWMEYIVFERTHNRYQNIQTIYNRAIHVLTDITLFEEKFNRLQVQGHL